MDIKQTVKELFEPTFEAIGDSELDYERKRALLYNMYCFACAVCPDYVGTPHKTLFEYGCCFLIEPERHPDYNRDEPEFVHTAASSDALSFGGRWYEKNDRYFIKYDYGSKLFDKLATGGVIPPQDRERIPALSLYAAVYLCCNMFAELRPLWFTYYFYLDATNEPVDEEYDEKLFSLLHSDDVYDKAVEALGSMLIGDESELGEGKLYKWYKPFIARRRKTLFDVLEKRMAQKDLDFVSEYSTEMLKNYPENATLMNWNAAARTERIIRDRDAAALGGLIADLKEYIAFSPSPVLSKYLKLAELMKKNVDSGRNQ